MRKPIEDNDLNIISGVYTVEIRLQNGKFGLTLLAHVGGNRHGAQVLKAAIRKVFKDDSLIGLDNEGRRTIELLDASNKRLIATDRHDEGRRWFERMVVSCRIISLGS